MLSTTSVQEGEYTEGYAARDDQLKSTCSHEEVSGSDGVFFETLVEAVRCYSLHKDLHTEPADDVIWHVGIKSSEDEDDIHDDLNDGQSEQNLHSGSYLDAATALAILLQTSWSVGWSSNWNTNIDLVWWRHGWIR